MNPLLERTRRKVAEAAFFLDRIRETNGRHPEFGYFLSAFLSAVRSVGWVLQSDLRGQHRERFDKWWEDKKASLPTATVPFSVIVELPSTATSRVGHARRGRPKERVAVRRRETDMTLRAVVMPIFSLLGIIAGSVHGLSAIQPAATADAEFVFETAPFASAHASTIVETREGLVTAWFGGTREGAADVGIWLSRHVKGEWTPPIEVATGIQPDGERHPCWNPVLFDMPGQALMLFYKVGPSPQSWWGMVRTSRDSGRTWTDARRLPDGILGPIKNKPVQLPDGTLVAPSSTESPERPEHVARALRAHDRCRPDVDGRVPVGSRRRQPDRRDPAQHPCPSGRQAPGPRTHAVAACLRDLVR